MLTCIMFLFGCQSRCVKLKYEETANNKIKITGVHFSIVTPKGFDIDYEKCIKNSNFFSGEIKDEDICIDFSYGNITYDIEIDTLNYIYEEDESPFTKLFITSINDFPKEVEYHMRKYVSDTLDDFIIERSLIFKTHVRNQEEMKLVREILETAKF